MSYQTAGVTDSRYIHMDRSKPKSWEYSVRRGEYTVDLYDLLTAVQPHVAGLLEESKAHIARASPQQVGVLTSQLLMAIYACPKSSVTDNTDKRNVSITQHNVTARCIICNATFSPKRTDSKYCSSKCRQAAYRQRAQA